VETLPIFVRDFAEDQLLPWHRQIEAAERFGVTLAQVEEVALERGIMPARYQYSRNAMSVTDQLSLFRSTVAVIGCGGLGGYIVEELARLGVGRLVVIDPDLFEEQNLNRQLLSSPAELGCPKVEVAVRRVNAINPAVTIVPHRVAFSSDNGTELLASCHVVVDALDTIAVRRELAETCSELRIPLVHGAIAGWYGHVTTMLPGDSALKDFYAQHCREKGIEQQLGNLSFTPAVVASLQVAEVCKLLVGQGTPLCGRMLMIDLLAMEFHDIAIESTNIRQP